MGDWPSVLRDWRFLRGWAGWSRAEGAGGGDAPDAAHVVLCCRAGCPCADHAEGGVAAGSSRAGLTLDGRWHVIHIDVFRRRRPGVPGSPGARSCARLLRYAPHALRTSTGLLWVSRARVVRVARASTKEQQRGAPVGRMGREGGGGSPFACAGRPELRMEKTCPFVGKRVDDLGSGPWWAILRGCLAAGTPPHRSACGASGSPCDREFGADQPHR